MRLPKVPYKRVLFLLCRLWLTPKPSVTWDRHPSPWTSLRWSFSARKNRWLSAWALSRLSVYTVATDLPKRSDCSTFSDWLIDWLIDRIIERLIERSIDWLIDWKLLYKRNSNEWNQQVKFQRNKEEIEEEMYFNQFKSLEIYKKKWTCTKRKFKY